MIFFKILYIIITMLCNYFSDITLIFVLSALCLLYLTMLYSNGTHGLIQYPMVLDAVPSADKLNYEYTRTRSGNNDTISHNKRL